MKKTLFSLTILLALQANARDEHKHEEIDHANHIGPHVHGEAQLNIFIEGEHFNLNLESPAMNVFGFEHEPKTEEHLNQSHDALHRLKDAKWLTVNGGDCELENVDIDWKYKAIIHERFHGEHSHEHGEHSHEHGEHSHEHGEHSHEHGEHSHEHGEHSHEHSDVGAKFAYHCKNPALINSISVELFEAFSGFEKLNVQWIAGDKQGAQTLTHGNHKVKFSN